MDIKFGIQIEPQFGFDYKTILNIATKAEELGYDSIWSSDHFFLNADAVKRNCMEAWTLITALAVDTKEIRVGTLVTGNNYRYPAVLAKIASTVDRISEGRLNFGLGAGWKEVEYNAYGIPFPSVKDRMDMLEESIQIIKQLWTEDKVTFEGKHYQLKSAPSVPKPVQDLPPIFIGGTGRKRTLNIVAKYADYLNFVWFVDPKEIPELLDVAKQHCERVGRDFDSLGKSYFAHVIMGETEDELDAILKERAQQRGQSVEEFKKSLPGAFIGLPEEIIARFNEYIDYGFDYFQVMFPYGHDMKLTKKFANLVMKKIR